MKKLVALTVAAIMAGCVSTESGKSVEVHRSGFDNTKVFHIEPHGGSCKVACLGLGAQWSEKNPDVAYLFVKNWFGYVAIYDARLNIDGEIIELQRNQLTTELESEGRYMDTSQKAFVTPLETIEKILSAKRVWLQIDTNEGTREDMILDLPNDTKAYHALKRFMGEVGA